MKRIIGASMVAIFPLTLIVATIAEYGWAVILFIVAVAVSATIMIVGMEWWSPGRINS